MSDRFDFLEIGDEKPQTPPLSGGEETYRTGWQPGRLRAVEVIGDAGTGVGQFSAPTGLAVDQHGAVLIVDSNNHRIQRIGMNGEVKVYGRPGNAPGELWGPQAVAVDPNGQHFYVAEQGNHRVQCFQMNGQHRGVLTGLRNPSGLAFDMAGRLWVADTGNGRVLCFDTRGGKYIGCLDRAADVFRPISLACDRARHLYITEGAAEDVVCYAEYTRKAGSLGENRRLYAPKQIAIDHHGFIYMAESGADRLHVLSQRGESLVTFDTPSRRSGALRSPSGVALGPNGEIYVSDTLNHRVLRLEWEA